MVTEKIIHMKRVGTLACQKLLLQLLAGINRISYSVVYVAHYKILGLNVSYL